MENKDLAVLQDLLNKNLDLQIESQGMEELRNKLRMYIQDLLNNDFEKLLMLFYRVDLDEQKVKKTLVIAPPEKLADELTELIIQRQLKKIAIRKQNR